MAKDVGAKKVIVASCAPPIRYPNVYGIDMPSRKELVAFNRNEDEIATAIGADLVIFQTLSDLVESARQWNPSIEQFDCSVFTGKYITGGIDEEYFVKLEGQRADNVRGKLQLNTVMQNGTLTREEVHTALSTPTSHIGADENVGLHNSR